MALLIPIKDPNEIELRAGQIWQLCAGVTYQIVRVDVFTDSEIDSRIVLDSVMISNSGEIIRKDCAFTCNSATLISDLKALKFSLCLPCLDCDKFCGQACQRKS